MGDERIFRIRKEPNEHKIANSGELQAKQPLSIPKDTEKGFPLLQINEQYYNFDDLIITDETRERLANIITENKSTKRLHGYGLEPKKKILFCGPPGTGKTLGAKIISSMIGYPFVYVMFDSIISSYLGETATNLRRIFDFIENGKFVVLLDEFDIVGKRRDDPYEHGEVKRVVNNLMQMLDNFTGQSIIISATNHQHLLDKAIWRRFDDIIYFDLPDPKRREQLFEKYLRVLKRSSDFTLKQLSRATSRYSAADIAQICEEALRRSIVRNEEIVTKDHIGWAIAEQRRRKKAIAAGE